MITLISERALIQKGSYEKKVWKDVLMGLGPSIAAIGVMIIPKSIEDLGSEQIRTFLILMICMYGLTVIVPTITQDYMRYHYIKKYNADGYVRIEYRR